MVTNNSVELWHRCWEEGVADGYFPRYYVSQPPHRDTLTPVYYKVVSPDGPVFWRRKGDDAGKETSFFDFFEEAVNGFGVNSVKKEYTPWGDDG